MVKTIRKATKEEIENLSEIVTKHFLEDRINRYNHYKELLNNKYVISLICDTKHKNGYEIHRINSNALCEIYNLKSGKLITIIALRPAQVYRYYNDINKTPPKYLIEKAIINVNKNLNNI